MEIKLTNKVSSNLTRIAIFFFPDNGIRKKVDTFDPVLECRIAVPFP
jgi:hypothetical protein